MFFSQLWHHHTCTLSWQLTQMWSSLPLAVSILTFLPSLPPLSVFLFLALHSCLCLLSFSLFFLWCMSCYFSSSVFCNILHSFPFCIFISVLWSYFIVQRLICLSKSYLVLALPIFKLVHSLMTRITYTESYTSLIMFDDRVSTLYNICSFLENLLCTVSLEATVWGHCNQYLSVSSLV